MRSAGTPRLDAESAERRKRRPLSQRYKGWIKEQARNQAFQWNSPSFKGNTDMHPAILVVAIFAFLAVAVLSLRWFYSRSAQILDHWATDNRFVIVSRERRVFRRGPYAWTTGKGQDVYRITVEDMDGRTRSGYVRCGSLWSGLLSDKVVVTWDSSLDP